MVRTSRSRGSDTRRNIDGRSAKKSVQEGKRKGGQANIQPFSTLVNTSLLVPPTYDWNQHCGAIQVTQRTSLIRRPVYNVPRHTITGGSMFKATLDIASEIAHDLNVSRELVWEILKGRKFSSREQMEIEVCKALAELV